MNKLYIFVYILYSLKQKLDGHVGLKLQMMHLTQ